MPEPSGKPNPPPAASPAFSSAVRFLWPGRASLDFHWFSTLGWPDVRARPFVRVVDKQDWVRKQQVAAQKHLRGFLLEESPNSWTVLSINLRVVHIPRDDNSPLLERADLLQDAQQYLDFLRNPGNWNPERSPARFGPSVPQAVEVFVLGWACERNGHRRMARKLYRQAQVMREGHGQNKGFLRRVLAQAGRLLGRRSEHRSLRAQLERDLSTAWMWQTVLFFQQPNVSLQSLLRRFETLIRKFPNSAHLAEARESAATLKRMICEDEEHAKAAKPFEQMNPEERVRELIFQLRTQNGFQREQPGWCDIFTDPRGSASPAHQLLKFGVDAVPELIQAFDEQALTRSVGYQRDFVYSHRVLTVGDCAMAIVQKMFGRSFRNPGGPGNNPKEIANAWWQEARQKGLSHILVEGVEQGKESAARHAELLLACDPEALARALPRGFERAMEPWIKRDLVEIAAKTPGEIIIPFLQQRLHGYNLQWAVMAAWGLHQRGNADALAVMTQRWKAKLADGQDSEEGVDTLIAFLIACADETAFTALAADLPQRSATLRTRVVETLSDGALPFWLDPGFPGLWSNTIKQKLTPRSLEIIEELLVTSLEDTAGGKWTIPGPNGQSLQNPRVCDYAAKALAEQWPEKYTFHFFANQPERDRQRLECLNAWRKEKGLSTTVAGTGSGKII